MAAPRPVPTALKILRGNPGRRPLNLNEPIHTDLDTTCPVELDAVGREEWERIAPQLANRGQATSVDRGTLFGYCHYYALWMSLNAEASKHPAVIKAPSGYPIPNPCIGMANKAFALMLKAANELGITPSSRTKVTVSKAPTAQGKLDKFIKRA